MLREVPEAARAIGLQIQVLNASTSREIETAFVTLVHDRGDALFVAPTRKQLLKIIADEKDARLPIDARASLIVERPSLL
jgi:hypothetical protein